MKRMLLLAVLAFAAINMNATIHEIEVGGSLSVTPYYSPQFININQGDTVRWTWVLGTHNVTSTSGTIPFSSGDITSPGEWSFTFNVSGFYSYECTLFDHALTQNGTIQVDTGSSIDESADINIDIYPLPAKDQITFTLPENVQLLDITAFDITGKELNAIAVINNVLNVSDWKEGYYILMIETSEGIIRKRISIMK